MKFNMDRNAKWVSAIVPAAYSAAASTSNVINTMGYEEATVIYYVGAPAANAETQLTVLHSVSSTAASFAHLAGSTFTQGTPTAASNQIQIGRLNLQKVKQWIQIKNVGDGSNAASISVAVMLSGAKAAPFAQPTGATIKFSIS